MPRLEEIQTDKQLYPIESAALGHLVEFSWGTRRALVTAVEAAAIALKVTSGINNFKVNDPGYYYRKMDRTELELVRQYSDHMRENNMTEAA